MSDACFLFGLPYDLSSVITDWITAVSSLLTLFGAVLIGYKANKISEFGVSQSRREDIKKIFDFYADAAKIYFCDTHSFLDALKKINEAIFLAQLNQLFDVETFLLEVKENLTEGYRVYCKCYDRKSGKILDGFNEVDHDKLIAIDNKLLDFFFESANLLELAKKYFDLKKDE